MQTPTDIPGFGGSGDDLPHYPATEVTEVTEYTPQDREFYMKHQGNHWDSCYSCQIKFATFREAVAHFEKQCQSLWCKRCGVTFKTPQDRDDHFVHGFAHWLCGICKYDAPAVEVQERHWRNTNHKYECRGCGYWYGRQWWNKHLTTSHACTRCHKHHNDEEQRKQHETEHVKDLGVLQCIGRCGKEFPTVGGMYNHLETGLCDSSIDHSDVLRCFAIHQAAEYLFVRDRKGILKRIFEGKDVHIAPFKCPDKGCKNESFKYFSAFLQHTTTDRCNFNFNRFGADSMLVHMESNLFLDVAIARIKSMADNTRSGIQVLSIAPEHPKTRADAIMPDPSEFRHFFTNINRCVQVCLKELMFKPSHDSKKQGFLKIRVMDSFTRELEYLEKAYYKANHKYVIEVTNERLPHGDILIYFQGTRTGQPAWKYLREVNKLIRLFRVIVDFESSNLSK